MVVEEIKQVIPRVKIYLEHLQPGDPGDVWAFYRILTCTTILEQNRILVVVAIPLLDFNDKLEVYEILNLPVPFVQSQSQLGGSITAKLEFKSAAIAVDTKHTHFVLFTEEELEVCSKPLFVFCAFKSTLYPLNLNLFFFLSRLSSHVILRRLP